MVGEQEHSTKRDNTDRVAQGAPFVERRRPGRVNNTNPALIALLRGTSAAGDTAVEPDEADTTIDNLAAARGIMFGAVIGAMVWTAAALIIWLTIR
jgi:hypothetical protein